jgi:hypothetical protein
MPNSNNGFHNRRNDENALSSHQTKYTYTFSNHFHPFVGKLLEQLNKKSIDGIFEANFLESLEEHFFMDLYQRNESNKSEVEVKSFPKEIDDSEDGAYSIYNWELFFHVPLTIAVHLSKNQRFIEAQRWFHYIFDPTTNDGQFWRFLAFRKKKDVKQIDELLHLVSKPVDELDTDELAQKKLIVSGYETSRKHPFQPHAVARTRFMAYQYNVVMNYLDNLIAWGDSLFRQDTIETINEATQLYVQAANLLGPKPERIPQRGTIKPKTFAQLRTNGLDPLGNALVELEGQFPFNLYFPSTDGVDTNQINPLFGIGRTLYFCLPQNEKLLGYWDTVADRLFKIRHCMTIEGVVRQLPLFEPRIDPGMLVKAAAVAIDISSLVSGLNQPLAPVRSLLLIQKAQEICSEVRSMGNALLSALEKKDAEALGLLRQKHEISIQQLSLDVRYLQWKEAEEATKALLMSREIVLERYKFYQRLLGKAEGDLSELENLDLERRELREDNFDEVYNELVGRYAQTLETHSYPPLDIVGERSLLNQAGHISQGDLYLSRTEHWSLNILPLISAALRLRGTAIDAITKVLAVLPHATIEAAPFGVGATTEFRVGDAKANIGAASVRVLDTFASLTDTAASLASQTASYERRTADWILQNNLAARELTHIGRQIISSLIREQIICHEYENLKKQLEQAREIDQFLRDKFTNEVLYAWMQGELSKLYYEYYKLAFDTARKAEQTMKHELMRPELDSQTFIRFNYWDGGRKGLLSGEALHLDLKRMEMAYHDHNKREYELNKHISLRQLDPVAMLALKATGVCEVTLPEWLFDLDGPGHYMRRIKNVSLSIPAVTGPYTSVNCTLSLLKSTLRRSPQLRGGEEYWRAPDEEDTRFMDFYGTIQSMVTSNAQNDSGMFEPNLRDERFLPFEGAGVVSNWRLELPTDFRQFDYNMISDVILHMRYTARQGGGELKTAATKRLRELIQGSSSSGLTLLFSLKHDFATEWHRFLSSKSDFRANVKKEHFPYLVWGEDIEISGIEISVVKGKVLTSAVLEELDLGVLAESLQNNLEFEITVAENYLSDLDEDAQVFLIIKYVIAQRQRADNAQRSATLAHGLPANTAVAYSLRL